MNFIQYIKQVWKAGTSGGTPLSPDRLNHIEDGIKNNNSMISELNSNMTINLLNPTLQTTTQNGVTCTNNGDGTYTLNGTATGLVAISLNTINFAKLKENVKLCGCPSGGSNTTYKLSLIISETAVQQNDYGNGVIINNPSILTSNAVSLRIVAYKGTTLKSAIFKPMLTTNLSATYDDFVPYTGDTGRLNADVALLKSNIGQVELNSPYGLTTAKTLNIDTINNDKGYILRCQINTLQGTLPTSASLIGGNSFLLIGFSNIVNQKPRYGIQIAFGFGSNKIAIRNAPYVEGGGNWTNWRAI